MHGGCMSRAFYLQNKQLEPCLLLLPSADLYIGKACRPWYDHNMEQLRPENKSTRPLWLVWTAAVPICLRMKDSDDAAYQFFSRSNGSAIFALTQFRNRLTKERCRYGYSQARLWSTIEANTHCGHATTIFRTQKSDHDHAMYSTDFQT